MSKLSNNLAESFLNGEFEGLCPDAGAAKIGLLEDSEPSFDILITMLRSTVRSAQGAALYVLYNRAGPFPSEIVQLLHELSAHEDDEIRRWAEACQS